MSQYGQAQLLVPQAGVWHRPSVDSHVSISVFSVMGFVRNIVLKI